MPIANTTEHNETTHITFVSFYLFIKINEKKGFAGKDIFRTDFYLLESNMWVLFMAPFRMSANVDRQQATKKKFFNYACIACFQQLKHNKHNKIKQMHDTHLLLSLAGIRI